MIADFLLNLSTGVFAVLPVLSIPVGFIEALRFFGGIIGYINIVIPVQRLAPILFFILLVRQYKLIVSLSRFVFIFVPFID